MVYDEINKIIEYIDTLNLSTLKKEELQMVVDVFGINKNAKVCKQHNCRRGYNDIITFDIDSGVFICLKEELAWVIYPNLTIDLIANVIEKYKNDDVYDDFIQGIKVNPYKTNDVKLWLKLFDE